MAQDGARHAFMCAQERNIGEERNTEEKGNMDTDTNSTSIFSTTFTSTLFRAISCLLSVVQTGKYFPWRKQHQVKIRGYHLYLYPSDSPHLLVYQSQVRQGLISSPAQNAGSNCSECENSAHSNLACVHEAAQITRCCGRQPP